MKSTNNLIFFLAIIVAVLLGYLYFNYSNREPFSNDSKIPRQIWTYWDGKIPPFVQKCIESWHTHNSDYKITILNKQNLGLYLPEGIIIDNLKHANDSPARYSDFVRLLVLPIYGGIWMDASIICQKSLDWVHQMHVETDCEFVGYYREDFTTIPEYKYVESWFFACIPGSSFVQDWRDEFMRINDFSSVDDYVSDLTSKGIDFQNIPLERLNYLAIYLSAQATVQRPKTTYKLQLIKSDDTALKHWTDRGFHSDLAARDLVEKNQEHRNQPLIKIVGVVRNELLNLGSNLDVLF
jgi:hypothetical protein